MCFLVGSCSQNAASDERVFVLPLLSPHVHNPAVALKVRKTLDGKESYICRQGSAYSYPHNGPLVLP